MTTIKKLTDLEEILLKADADYRYTYTLDELIKSEKYLKEIGSITNLFFTVQFEYSKTIDQNDEKNSEKLMNYHNFLVEGELDIDDTKYIDFINKLKEKIDNKDILELINRIQPLDKH